MPGIFFTKLNFELALSNISALANLRLGFSSGWLVPFFSFLDVLFINTRQWILVFTLKTFALLRMVTVVNHLNNRKF